MLTNRNSRDTETQLTPELSPPPEGCHGVSKPRLPCVQSLVGVGWNNLQRCRETKRIVRLPDAAYNKYWADGPKVSNSLEVREM